MTEFGLVEVAGITASTMLLIGMLFALVRIVGGPSLPDRVVALDLLTVLAMGIIGLRVIATGDVLYLEIALALATDGRQLL